MTNAKKITGLSVQVGERPEVVTINNDLEGLQSAVGGYIQAVYLDNDVIMLVDEEGLLKDLPVNFKVCEVDGGLATIKEFIHGNVLFVSSLGDNFHSLDKTRISEIKRKLSFDRELYILNY